MKRILNKLSCIWNIMRADQFALFTFEEAAPDPEWLTVPTFRWHVSENWDKTFFWFIKQRMESIEKYNSPIKH